MGDRIRVRTGDGCLNSDLLDQFLLIGVVGYPKIKCEKRSENLAGAGSRLVDKGGRRSRSVLMPLWVGTTVTLSLSCIRQRRILGI